MPAVKTRGFMLMFFFVAGLAILAFLCFTGPEGVMGPRHRH
jgi:hypothetical protein